MNIALTGSLGHISKHLLRELVEDGAHRVTVMSSREERRRPIEELGGLPLIGSVEDSDFLASSFAGADATYLMIPPNYHGESDVVAYYRRIGENYARAIEASGVRRVVHLSSFGAHLEKGAGPITGSHEVEQVLNRLDGVELTHLRATYLYYNLEQSMTSIRQSGSIFANYGEAKFPLVSPRDIARAAARHLLYERDCGVEYVASDERNGPEIASVLGAAMGMPNLRWVIVEDEQVAEALRSKGITEPVVEGVVELYSSLRTGALTENYRERVVKFGSFKLEDYAREFAEKYEKVRSNL